MIYNKEPEQNPDQNQNESPGTPYSCITVFKTIVAAQGKSNELVEDYADSNSNDLLLQHLQYADELNQIRPPHISRTREYAKVQKVSKSPIMIDDKLKFIRARTRTYVTRQTEVAEKISRHKKEIADMFISLDAQYVELHKEEDEYNKLLNEHAKTLEEYKQQERKANILTRILKWIKLS